MGLRILVSGAGGTVGSDLLPALKSAGHEVIRLTRGASGSSCLHWDPMRPLDAATFPTFDAVIHLAGESIIGRWTASKRRRILESRVFGTRHLAEAMARSSPPPKVFISASAIGYYGDRGEEILTESAAQGSGFTAETCLAWEAATRTAEDAGIRTVRMRIGVVLSGRGGALAKMRLPYRLGLGGRIGSGHQWWSWIQVQDLVGAIQHTLATGLRGPVNAVSPRPVRNAEFNRVLARALSRPAIFPMPEFVVRAAFGLMGEELWLASQRVLPEKLVSSGYQFQYPDLGAAISHSLEVQKPATD
ncbi:MAG TPA: TIGR01777 family oxidoreductase [Terriglobales bacterium]